MKVYAHWQDDSLCMHQNWLTWVEKDGHKNDSNINSGGLYCRTESLPPNGCVWLSHHQNVSKGQQRFLHFWSWCIFWWDRCRRQSLPAVSWEQKRRNLTACLATGNQDLHFFRTRLRSWSLTVFLPQEQIPSAVENITPFTFKHRFKNNFCLKHHPSAPQCARFQLFVVGGVLHSLVWTLQAFCPTLWTGGENSFFTANLQLSSKNYLHRSGWPWRARRRRWGRWTARGTSNSALRWSNRQFSSLLFCQPI